MIGINSVRALLVPALLAVGMLLGAISVPDQEVANQEIASETAADSTHSSPQQQEPDHLPQEPVFEGWEVPAVALFISGRQNGYIEPCGCTGLANQLGGMMRRHTLIHEMRSNGWNVVGLDTGNQVRRFGRQANMKITTTYQCLGEDLEYSAVGFGPDDLKLPTIELLAAMTNSELTSEAFVCANVTVFDPEFSSRYRVIDQGGKRIGLTMVLGDEHLPELAGMGDLTTQSVSEGLREVIGPLQAEECDVNLLVAFTALDKSRELANEFPVFDVLVTCGVDGEPTRLPETIRDPGSRHVTQMIQVGAKSMHVGVIGLYDQAGGTRIQYQRVPLDSRYADSEPIKQKFLEYQRQMQSLGLSRLEVKPISHPSGRKYVGSEACYDCHDGAYDIWRDGIDGEGGPHFRATLDLTDPGERTWVKRHHDPECLSCHVTGWNPQEFFPYESGYLKLDDEHLHGSGCENCHGPGSKHVAAENGDIDVTEEQRVQFYQEMIVTLEQARRELCITCHDLDNSPDFHVEGAFDRYWEKIRHDE